MFGVRCLIFVDIRSGSPRDMHEPQRETWNHCSYLLAAISAHRGTALQGSCLCPQQSILPHRVHVSASLALTSKCYSLLSPHLQTVLS